MKCRICGNKTDNTVYKVPEMMFGLNETFEYLECSKCGCLQIVEFPEDMSRYYPDGYYSFSDNNGIYRLIESTIRAQRDRYVFTNKGLIGHAINSIYPFNYADFLLNVHPGYHSKILDVGCGSGQLLRCLADAGFEKLYGVDPYIKEDINYKGNANIKKGDIFGVNGKYDVIMFNHSFEHMRDPHKVIAQVSRLLSEDGTCIIRIPTTSSYAWCKYKENWVQLDAPRHFFLYSIESIKDLISSSDLVLNDLFYDSTSFQFWGSEQYVKGIPLYNPQSYAVDDKNIFSKSDIDIFKKRAEELNKNKSGDQVVLYIIKKK